MFSERHTMIDIPNELVRDLNDWFFSYVQTFKDGDANAFNIVLKEEHTRRVCREIAGIGE